MISNQSKFVFDPLLNMWQVKTMKYSTDVGESGGSENESGSIVLNMLEFRKR